MMDGIGAAKEVAGLVTAIGIVPTLLIVAVAIFFILREVKKQISGVGKAVDALRVHSDERDREIYRRLEKIEKDIHFIENDYMTKEQHYRDLEGWKSEIGELRKQVANLPLEIIKLTQQIRGKE